jgi:hypothetical protein
MKALLPTALTSLMLAFPVAASAQVWPGQVAPAPVPYASPYTYASPYLSPSASPNLGGVWYLDGQADKPTRILQYNPQRALFINEHGSEAWGTIQGNRVWIPDWSSSYGPGLAGTVWGNRIQWPDGSFWSR